MNSEERSAKISELDQRATSRLSEVIAQTQDVLDRMMEVPRTRMSRGLRAGRLEVLARDMQEAVRDIRNADRLSRWDGKSFDSTAFAHLEERGWITEARLLKELWDAQKDEETQ